MSHPGPGAHATRGLWPMAQCNAHCAHGVQYTREHRSARSPACHAANTACVLGERLTALRCTRVPVIAPERSVTLAPIRPPLFLLSVTLHATRSPLSRRPSLTGQICRWPASPRTPCSCLRLSAPSWCPSGPSARGQSWWRAVCARGPFGTRSESSSPSPPQSRCSHPAGRWAPRRWAEKRVPPQAAMARPPVPAPAWGYLQGRW
mmetsp:Transcript_49759/g.129698  ORF Transcript_49759/g.129698 Transcript_49759/m.129698 type:complete len:205 (+) Transcript_49759:33-647(+)